MYVIILILAIVELVKRPRFAALAPCMCPDVPTDAFQEWKRLELRRRDVIIWLGLGVAATEFIAVIVLQVYVVLVLLFWPVLFVAVIVSAVIGNKANQLKEQYDIVIDIDRPLRTEESSNAHASRDDACLACSAEMPEKDDMCPSCGWL